MESLDSGMEESGEAADDEVNVAGDVVDAVGENYGDSSTSSVMFEDELEVTQSRLCLLSWDALIWCLLILPGVFGLISTVLFCYFLLKE